MSILSGTAITAAIANGDLGIDPMPPWPPGPNSLDLRIGDRLMRYAPSMVLDPEAMPPLVEVEREADGRWLILPRVLYLAQTMERTTCRRHVPYVDGRSSTGRLGLSVHVTAGRGDIGFDGVWTLEVTSVHAVLLRPGSRILQMTLHEVTGTVAPYTGQYQGADVIQASGLGDGS